MSYMKVLSDIKKGNIASTYLLKGTENYFINELVKNLTKSLGEKVEGETHHYDLAETSIQEVIMNAETLPFFSEKKLIFLHNPVFLKARPDKLPFIHDVFKFEEYLLNPPEYSHIVMIANYEKIDGRKKIAKLINKHAVVADCSPVKDYEMKKWITMLAKEHFIQFSNEALQLIEAELSNNLVLLENEIEKIAMYSGKNTQVSLETVKQLLSVSTSQSALELVDAVLKRNLKDAIHIATDLKKANEEPIALLALLAYQFRIILQVKLLLQSGMRENELQKHIKAHPYVIKLAVQRSRQFSVERLEYIMREIAETDTIIKSGQMEKTIAFELLLYMMIQQT